MNNEKVFSASPGSHWGQVRKKITLRLPRSPLWYSALQGHQGVDVIWTNSAIAWSALHMHPALHALPSNLIRSPWLSPAMQEAHTHTLTQGCALTRKHAHAYTHPRIDRVWLSSRPLFSQPSVPRIEAPCNDLAAAEFGCFDAGPVSLSGKPSESWSAGLGSGAVSRARFQRGVHLLLPHLGGQGKVVLCAYFHEGLWKYSHVSLHGRAAAAAAAAAPPPLCGRNDARRTVCR